jgi:hypothetical protein
MKSMEPFEDEMGLKNGFVVSSVDGRIMVFQLLQPFDFLVPGVSFFSENAKLLNTVFCKNEVIQVSYATSKKVVAIDVGQRIVWWTAD